MKWMKLIIALSIALTAPLHPMHEHRDDDASSENALIIYEPPYGEPLAQFLNNITNHLPGLPPVFHRSYLENPISLSLVCLFAALFDHYFISPNVYRSHFSDTTRPPLEKAQFMIEMARCANTLPYIKYLWLGILGSVLIGVESERIVKSIPLHHKTEKSLTKFINHLKEHPSLRQQLPSGGKIGFIKESLDKNINSLSSSELAHEFFTRPFFKEQHDAHWDKQIQKLIYSKKSSTGYPQFRHNLVLGCYIATLATLVYFVWLKRFICE